MNYSGGRPAARTTIDVPVAGHAGLPANGVGAIEMNLASVAPATNGYVTVYPAGASQPRTSDLNVTATVPVLGILTFTDLIRDGNVKIYLTTTMDLVADLEGWYTA